MMLTLLLVLYRFAVGRPSHRSTALQALMQGPFCRAASVIASRSPSDRSDGLDERSVDGHAGSSCLIVRDPSGSCRAGRWPVRSQRRSSPRSSLETELQPGSVGHTAHVPRWVPDKLDVALELVWGPAWDMSRMRS